VEGVGVAPDAALEGGAGRFRRPVDVGRAAIGDMGEDPAVDGRNLGEGGAVQRVDIGAVDEGAAFDLERRGASLREWWDDRASRQPSCETVDGSKRIPLLLIRPIKNRIFQMMGCPAGMELVDPPWMERSCEGKQFLRVSCFGEPRDECFGHHSNGLSGDGVRPPDLFQIEAWRPGRKQS